MLQYYAKQKIACLAFSFIATLVFYVGTSVSAGGLVPPSGMGVVTMLLLFASFAFMSVRIAGRRVDAQVEALLDAYNVGCDPAYLHEGGARLAATIRSSMEKEPASNALGSWFLSFYATAAADLGKTQEADEMARLMVNVATKQKDPLDQAAVMINLEPLVLRLHGATAAEALLKKALELLQQADQNQAAPYVAYAAGEGALLTCMQEGNTDSLLKIFEDVRANEAQHMRMRVMYADAAASIYQAQGNYVAERRLRSFVAENGNKLPLVAANQQRLAQIP